jgi:hypothetical protein
MDDMGYPSQIQGMNPPPKLPIAENDLFPDRHYLKAVSEIYNTSNIQY